MRDNKVKIKNFDNHTPYFRGVAIATLLCGVLILALGIVELALNIFHGDRYSEPLLKIIGGLIIVALGYIHFELEMLRIK